jgi:hypothetical protein
MCAPLPPLGVGGWRHPKAPRRVFVQARRRAEAGAVERRRDHLARLERPPEAPEAKRLGVSTRRDSHHGREHALQMMGAQVHARSNVGQRRLALGLALDERTALAHRVEVWLGGPRRVRPAATARPEARPFGGLGDREKSDVGAPRAAARARGATLDARGADRVDESVVGAGAAHVHAMPARVVRREPVRFLDHGGDGTRRAQAIYPKLAREFDSPRRGAPSAESPVIRIAHHPNLWRPRPWTRSQSRALPAPPYSASTVCQKPGP